MAASVDEVRKAISNQFISQTRRVFVDRKEGKRIYFSPFPGNVLGTEVAVPSSADAVPSHRELTVWTWKKAI